MKLNSLLSVILSFVFAGSITIACNDKKMNLEIGTHNFASPDNPDPDTAVVPNINPDFTGIPGYSAYRTVEETNEALSAMIIAYPGLVKVIDIGNSWEKATDGGLAGYDIQILVLTNQHRAGNKPKLLIVAGLDASCYVPPQLALEFAQKLLLNYGKDADSTMIIDNIEIHFIFHANPDGRKHAETGMVWVKNTHGLDSTSSSRGVNLDRNFSWMWGTSGGSSNNSFDTYYRGANAASEPETQAIQSYYRYLFSDQRNDDLSSPAPLSVSGMLIVLNNYGNNVYWPWCFSSLTPPNPELATIGRRIASFNRYNSMQSQSISIKDGTLLSAIYGELGIPSVGIAPGNEYFTTSDDYLSEISPDNLKALEYAARIVWHPYSMANGPMLYSVSISTGKDVNISVTADDSRFIDPGNVETINTISAVYYSIDKLPWDSGSMIVQMSPSDGSFNAPVETASVLLDADTLEIGTHIIYFQARDSSGAEGPVSSKYIYIYANPDLK